VPAGQRDLTLRAAVGSLTAAAVAADAVRAEADVGSVALHFSTVSGNVTGKSSVGDFDLTVGERGPAGADIEVGTGSARPSLPATTRGEFDCTVGVGGLEATAAYGMTSLRGMTSAQARWRRGEGGGKFRVHAAVGEIALR